MTGLAPPVAGLVLIGIAATIAVAPANGSGLAAADAAAIRASSHWQRLARPPLAELRPLGSAHPGAKRIYTSVARAKLAPGGRQRYPYPRGTTIVKVATTANVATLVAIMRKTAVTNPRDGGWDYVEYQRSSGAEPFSRVAFPESGCADCHRNAATRQRTDWVFYSLR